MKGMIILTETLFIFSFPFLGDVTLSASSAISLLGIFVSLIASLIAIVISVVSLRQNSKMIEESSRPVIGIYSDSINPGNPMFYLIVKNFGNSTAVITKFDYDYDLKDCYKFRADRDYLKDLVNCTIAPHQSRICSLDYQKISRPIKFDIEYTSCNKTYSDSFTIDLKTGVSMPIGKVATKDMELRTISYTLQEMLTKHL